MTLEEIQAKMLLCKIFFGIGENQCINSKRLDSCQESSEKYFAGRLSLRSLTFRREIFGGSESREDPTLVLWIIELAKGNTQPFLSEKAMYYFVQIHFQLVLLQMFAFNRLTKRATAFRTVLYLDSSKRRLKGRNIRRKLSGKSMHALTPNFNERVFMTILGYSKSFEDNLRDM
ncbi:hypothetical protein V1478_001938 [Vespula squamosa]|uniref:Uncharacterized protein n=1 Tax=Vespula squamosa TaxID=30214 RepID=A0ABD2BYJ5_VESSQ